MSRLQLALNVSDLDEAIGFYTKLFSAAPAKVRPGYANFSVADPPLKLVLIEAAEGRGRGVTGALNHLGVEVDSTAEVAAATSRLSKEGLPTTEEHETTCCYAVQDKVWVEDPDAAPWEVYTVLADAPVGAEPCGDAQSVCCQLQTDAAPADAAQADAAPADAAPAASTCC